MRKFVGDFVSNCVVIANSPSGIVSCILLKYNLKTIAKTQTSVA